MQLLLISGSLRRASSNSRALQAIERLAPTGCLVHAAKPLDHLPYFNPDVEQEKLPDAAAAWRNIAAEMDALVISSPEYARGVPGVLKNALDWLVGGIEIIGKPIALVNATPPAEYAQAQLRETLTVMGGRVIADACIELPLRGRTLDAESIAADPQMADRIRTLFSALDTVAHTG